MSWRNRQIFSPRTESAGNWTASMRVCRIQAHVRVPGPAWTPRLLRAKQPKLDLPLPDGTATPTPHGVLTLAFFPSQTTSDRGVTPQSPQIESGRVLPAKHQLGTRKAQSAMKATPGRSASTGKERWNTHNILKGMERTWHDFFLSFHRGRPQSTALSATYYVHSTWTPYTSSNSSA